MYMGVKAFYREDEQMEATAPLQSREWLGVSWHEVECGGIQAITGTTDE